MVSKFFKAAVLLMTFLFSSPFIAGAQPAAHAYKGIEQTLLQGVNDYRKSIGLKPLRWNIYLSNVAEKHSRDMATKKAPYGNEGFKERTDKIYETLKPVYGFAENIDSGRVGAKDVITDWLNSTKHKKNLEGDYNYTGIGIVKSADSNMYITEIFILQ